MSLIYRGHTAQPSATAKMLETGMKGKFLGRSFPSREGQKSARRAAPYLQHRGVMY